MKYSLTRYPGDMEPNMPGATPALMANVGEVSIQQEVGQGLSLWFWAALAAVAILVFVKRP